MIPALNGLPSAVVTRSSGPLTAGFVHGSAQVGLQSDGKGSFRGAVKENGVVGDNYLFAAALTGVKDDRGATVVFAHTGNVAGSLTVGKDHDEFQVNISDKIIADQWDLVRSSPVQFRLHVSTDPFQVTEGFLGSFLVLGLVKLIEEAAQNTTVCVWSSDDNFDDGEMQQCSDPNDGGIGGGGPDGEDDD